MRWLGRRKDNESDLRTLKQDIPRIILVVAILAVLAHWFPKGGGLTANGAGVEEFFKTTNAAWAKTFDNLKHGRALWDNDQRDSINDRLRRLSKLRDANGQLIPQRIEHIPDTDVDTEDVPMVQAPAPRQRFDRGYDVAPGVTDTDANDDEDDPCPQARAQQRPQVRVQQRPVLRRHAGSMAPILPSPGGRPVLAQVQTPETRRVAPVEAGSGIYGSWTAWAIYTVIIVVLMVWGTRTEKARRSFFITLALAAPAVWYFY